MEPAQNPSHARILFFQFHEKTHFLCRFLLSPQSPIGTGQGKVRVCARWADPCGCSQMRERFSEVAPAKSKFSKLVVGVSQIPIVCYRGLEKFFRFHLGTFITSLRFFQQHPPQLKFKRSSLGKMLDSTLESCFRLLHHPCGRLSSRQAHCSFRVGGIQLSRVAERASSICKVPRAKVNGTF